MNDILNEADIFGIAFLDDGATMKPMPLVNIICLVKNASVAVI